MPAETIDCPICHQPMQKQEVPQGVEIDFCETHGVWLDAGELQAIIKVEQNQAKAEGAAAGARSAGTGHHSHGHSHGSATVGQAVAGSLLGAGVSALIRAFFGGRRW